MSTLGVVVLSLQGMKGLELCLRSIEWADAVLVLHFGEEEISKDGFAVGPEYRHIKSAQEVRSFSQQMTTDWVLYLWGEERIEAKLEEELRSVCEIDVAKTPSAYCIPVRSLVLNQWVEGSLWEPTPAPRLTRRAGGFPVKWWEPRTKKTEETYGVLMGWIGDYGLSELTEGIIRVQAISSVWMEHLKSKGVAQTISSVLWSSARIFFRLLALNKVFAGGFAGLLFSTLGAYAALLACAKLWETKHLRERTRAAS